MPRPRLLRRIRCQPEINYFKPIGIRINELEEVLLTFVEFEAIRLKDLENLDQDKAAKKMNISQPTFHRILQEARKKVADALINGKAIKIHGGSYKMVRPRGSGRGLKRGMGFGGPAINCVCPKCGYKEPKIRGIRCLDKKCPKCNTMMIRGK